MLIRRTYCADIYEMKGNCWPSTDWQIQLKIMPHMKRHELLQYDISEKPPLPSALWFQQGKISYQQHSLCTSFSADAPIVVRWKFPVLLCYFFLILGRKFEEKIKFQQFHDYIYTLSHIKPKVEFVSALKYFAAAVAQSVRTFASEVWVFKPLPRQI